MTDPTNLLLFMGATLALNVTPGPDMLYVIARSASEGRRAGVASALGIAGGTVFHTLAVVLGLSSLLLAVPFAYDAVRLGGAAYLVYLGLRAILRPAGASAGTQRVAPASLWAIFRQGVVTNVLNPKVALFFLAFLPQFVDPARGRVPLQLLLLGVLFNASGTLVNLAVALAASGAGRWGRARVGGSALLQRLTGVVFVGLGVRLALQQRR
ncbi:LysE family translocator [Aggregicoccus sp. 17bor-14]|uniref:LysE family translocator n=1 Tax=Myxococcaceae TaxID=31 RepID=UPI00129C9EF1|nr:MULTISPECIES: LysE family translocator [Myxococcaceae]MBF5044547.1 LysE family translocator [Simulacricoccus sp. 17bor-14]MRI90292.1 LysE family translocator [Aggregicoccus sp. 17bor-14]